MSLNISTNTAALRAGAYLSSNNANLQKSLDRLASGKKLTSPVDDPGGLAVSMKLSAAVNRYRVPKTMSRMPSPFWRCRTGCLIRSARSLTG